MPASSTAFTRGLTLGIPFDNVIKVRDSLAESHPALAGSVPVVRRAVVEFARVAGIHGEALERVGLAVSEAVTNVVHHAYRTQPGRVHITARAINDELWVLVADEGCGHNLPTASPGLGWGLAIITDACDEFTLVERAQGGTEARMLFRIPGAHKQLKPADQ